MHEAFLQTGPFQQNNTTLICTPLYLGIPNTECIHSQDRMHTFLRVISLVYPNNGSFHIKTAGGIFSTITRGGDKSTKENEEEGGSEKRRQLLQPRMPDLPDPDQVEEDAPDNINVPGVCE